VPHRWPPWSSVEAAPFSKKNHGYLTLSSEHDDKGPWRLFGSRKSYSQKVLLSLAVTIYLASGHDEEVGGANGSSKDSAYKKLKGCKLPMTLDEEDLFTEAWFPVWSQPVAMWEFAENASLLFRLIAGDTRRHSSAPRAVKTLLGSCGSARLGLENNASLPYKLAPITTTLYLGAELPFSKKTSFCKTPLAIKGSQSKASIPYYDGAKPLSGGVKTTWSNVSWGTINF